MRYYRYLIPIIALSLLVIPVYAIAEFNWTLVNGSSGWFERSAFQNTAAVLPDGSVVIMGGMNSTHDYNDVWMSTDRGQTWILQCASAPWSARHYFSVVVQPDGSIVLMGGMSHSGTRTNDVWRSTDKGVHWTLMTASAGWSARNIMAAVATVDGGIVIMGGFGAPYGLPGYKSDTWRSTDNGSTWTQMSASAGWGQRAGSAAVVLHDNSILLIGGDQQSTNKNDAWRSLDNGSTWVLWAESAPWSPRYGHNLQTLSDGSLILYGGWNAEGLGWRSVDNGKWWSPVYGSPVGGISSTGAAMNDSSYLVMGGGYTNTTYRGIFWQSRYSLVPSYAIPFNDNELSTPVSRNWSFGDGTYSSSANVTHVYPAIGDYNVTLTRTDSAGVTTTFQNYTIHVSTNLLYSIPFTGGGYYFLSNDRGATWVKVYPEQITDYNYWLLSDSMRGQVAAYIGNHTILISSSDLSDSTHYRRVRRSVDDGATFNDVLVVPASSDTDDWEYRFANLGNGGVLAITGINPDLYVSYNYGETWGLMSHIITNTSEKLPPKQILYLGDGRVVISLYNVTYSFGQWVNDIYTSDNYGETFTYRASLGSNSDVMNQFTYLGNGVILASLEFGNSMWRSTDFGNTWSTVDYAFGTGGYDYVQGLANIGSGEAEVLTYDVIYNTTNYGVNWSVISSGDTDLSANEEANMVYLGDNTLLLGTYVPGTISTDRGLSWARIDMDQFNTRILNSGGDINFTYSKSAGMGYQFTDTSTNVPTVWNWSFGDYTYSSEQNPNHTFAHCWTYTVTLTTYNENEILSKSMLITAVGTVNVGQVQFYTPKKVRFVAHDYLGKPIVGMNVSVIGVESSLGSLDWLPYLFGINLNNTPLLDTHMNASTGSDGAVTFIMVDTEKYELHYVDTSHGIDEKRYYYPKEEEYLEVFWTEYGMLTTPTPAPCGSPEFNYSSTPNSTYMTFTTGYYDCSGNTANMTFYVKSSRNKQTLYSETIFNPNNFLVTKSVPITQGEIYHYGVNGTTVTGGHVYQDIANATSGSRWFANFLKASDDDLNAMWVYNAIAIAVVSMFTYVFGRISIKAGMVIFPLIVAVFWGMGWLQTTFLLVAFALLIGIMFYLRTAESEAGL